MLKQCLFLDSRLEIIFIFPIIFLHFLNLNMDMYYLQFLSK